MSACPLLHFLHTHVRDPRPVDGCSSHLPKPLVLFVCRLQWRRFMTAVGYYNCTLQAGSGNTTASSASTGRRLLERVPSEGLQHNPEYPARRLRQAPGSGAQYSCKKLVTGGRTLWIELTGAVSGILQQQCCPWGMEGVCLHMLLRFFCRLRCGGIVRRAASYETTLNQTAAQAVQRHRQHQAAAALTRFCSPLLSAAAIAGGRVAVQAPTSGYRSR